MFKAFYIKERDRGVLYDRDDFQRILQPGTYRRLWATRWRVVNYDLNQPEARIPDLEFLLQTHRAELESHLVVVRTAFNEVALVKAGQQWISVAPNRLKAFWRGFTEIEVHRFNLDQQLELPTELVQQVRGIAIDNLLKFQVSEAEIGLLYVQDNFVRPLEAGEYAFWTFNRKVQVRSLSKIVPNPQFPLVDVLIDQHPDFVATYCELVQLTSNQTAIVRYQSKAIELVPPSSRKLFWKGVEIEIIDIEAESKLPVRLVKELVTGSIEVAMLSHESLHTLEVPAQHIGLLYLDSVLQEPLAAGTHTWWKFGRSIKTESLDLRLQTLEVSGQEILSKDKVPLRLNLTAGYRIADPIRAKTTLIDISGFLYKELQFGLRSAVGTRSLDQLLEDKTAIDTTISDYIRAKVVDYGIEVESVGVKDIILPGEIKAILGKVVEAEKAAQANVVRRREETAATRSMLNTAKVMEDNPVALRLKELEVLERIAEKIENINVNGGLESILTELIKIKGQPS
ncbi:band 7 protein [Leptolyngbya sp. NIES-3755]|nr:band 7 protein [Leptolyngbya sp. NIES-3755]